MMRLSPAPVLIAILGLAPTAVEARAYRPGYAPPETAANNCRVIKNGRSVVTDCGKAPETAARTAARPTPAAGPPPPVCMERDRKGRCVKTGRPD